MNFLKPTKLKLISLITILPCAWLGFWFSDSLSVNILQSSYPDFFKAVVSGMKPAFGSLDADMMKIVWLLFYGRIAIVLVCSYLGACVLEAIVDTQIGKKPNNTLESETD